MADQFSYFFRLSSVLESMPDALVIVDKSGRIVLINKQTEKLFGYDRAELLGELVEHLMPLRFRGRHQQHRTNFFDSPRTRPMGVGLELFGLHKNDTEFPIELSLSPLKTDEGTYVLAAVRDISEQKALAETLHKKNEELKEQNRRVQEANRLKSEFLANMSHELRTPLNGIIGFAELMHSEKVGAISPEHKEYLGDILSSSHHLLQLINDVLDLAKVEAGKMEFHPEKIDLDKLINEVRDILRTLLYKNKIDLKIQIESTLTHVVIDPAKLKQVLYNYISNAIKFTPNEGHVTIKVSSENENNFRLDVEDTGIGIHPEDLNRLFVEFQQLDASFAKKYQGTGLGLALTRRIVEAQGGKVDVKSTIDKGSVFSAILPKTPLTLAPTTELGDEKKKLVQSLPGAPTILVVEDDPEDCTFIVNTLMQAGYAVETAVNGMEALCLGQARQFDAITLDLLLPDMSGWDVLRGFRNKGCNQNTPVIVMTVIAEKLGSIGFNIENFLEKPMKTEELLKALQRVGVVAGDAKKILVVDDDPNILKLTKLALKRSGYQAIFKSDGKSGLAAVEEMQPAAIILDLLMPEMDGFEFLHHLRKSKQGQYIPVIVWTVKELDQSERKRLCSSAQAIVLKEKGSVNSLLVELQRFIPPP